MRRFYQVILSLHPAGFRSRFRDEMVSDFDQSSQEESQTELIYDALLSLVRQWLFRTDLFRILAGVFAAAAQAWWVWRLLQKPSASKHSWAGPGDPYAFVLLSALLVCGLFAMVIGASVWNVRAQGRRLTRRKMVLPVAAVVLLASGVVHAQQGREQERDSSPHAVQFVDVERDVRLEVLDWGGKGLPLIFLAGAGFDAHVFDKFAPQFAVQHHVFGITRWGSGKSSSPQPTADNYSADRLGDDVLAVMDRLKISRPVLIGHSLAGEEMSSIGSRHPEAVSGLVYLDAGYSYAYYAEALGDPIIDAIDLHKQLTVFLSRGFQDSKTLQSLQEASAHLDRDLRALAQQRALMPPQPVRPANAPPPAPIPVALSKGRRKYTEIRLPVLAIFADPHDFGQLYQDDPKARAAVVENDRAATSAQADAFQAGVPSARVVRIANADHFIFRSNEAEVVREINRFLRGLS